MNKVKAMKLGKAALTGILVAGFVRQNCIPGVGTLAQDAKNLGGKIKGIFKKKEEDTESEAA